MTEIQAVFLLVIGFCVYYFTPKLIRYIYEKEFFHIVFMIFAGGFFTINFPSCGFMFSMLSYLTWPMKEIPEPGLNLTKDKA